MNKQGAWEIMNWICFTASLFGIVFSPIWWLKVIVIISFLLNLFLIIYQGRIDDS